MAELKFGPEWLRALSDCGPSVQNMPATSAPTRSYKLAEHRYGREEMLALFDRDAEPPEDLREFTHVFIEKMQLPLAIVAMNEEEQRLWTRCVNSDAVMRLTNKSGGSGSGGGGGGERERVVPTDRGVGGAPIRGGRGAGMADRGRGRGKSSYYQRGTSYDDEGDSPERREFRPRSFERSTSVSEDATREKRFERSISRGGGNSSEDNGHLGRKDISRSSVDNWRTAGRGEDREGWRTAGRSDGSWNRVAGGSSWRSGERGEKDENDPEHYHRNGPLRDPRRPYNTRHRENSEGWDDVDDDDRRNSLPEWSLDDGPESDTKVGTFDASGAFRETNLEDDELEELEPHGDNEREVSDEEVEGWKTVERSRNKNCKDDGKGRMANKPKIDHRVKDTKNASSRNDDTNVNVTKSESNKALQQSAPVHQIPQSSQSSSSMSSSSSSVPTLNQPPNSSNSLEPSVHRQVNVSMKSPLEEDGFAHLEKAAESMVAQWTAEEDQKESHVNFDMHKIPVLPTHHVDAYKWFYRDPQGEIQGPFTPQEMLEWFTAGYFAMDLLVRRGCDERFSQLGELIKTWERVPFSQGQNPPPLGVHSPSPQSLSSATATMASLPQPNKSDFHAHQQHILHQQQVQQHMYMNQQMEMQSQLRQLLAQLKKQEGFSDLSQQQQQEVLVQHYVAAQNSERQGKMQPTIPIRPQNQPQLIDSMPHMRMHPAISPRIPTNQAAGVQMPGPSIWDLNGGPLTASAIEEMQRKELERKDLEDRQRKFEEERRRMEENEARKMEEEQKRKLEIELHIKLEEERQRNHEILRKQEEERRKREDEERMRIEEERQRMEEERRMMEEQRRRQEELIRLEEFARRQQQEEVEKRRREAEEMEKERQRQLHLEMERRNEVERIRQLQQQEQMKKLQEQQRKAAAWGGQAQAQQQQQQQQQSSALSLAEIQKLQEEKEREERQRHLQQQQMQVILQAQQQQQQQQQKQLTWANAYQRQSAPVKTLAEIQQEESEKLVKQRHLEQQKQAQQGNPVPNSGIWNNAASHLSWKSGTNSAWNTNQSASSISSSIEGGFWDHDPINRKVQANRANESALPQSNNKGGGFPSKSNTRSKKDEEAVMKLFENQRRQPSDQFTQWCTDALAKFQSSVDIPTFISFLKDVESPYEVNDYVRSYLGDSKDTREFAKNFIDRRSYYRNQAKKEATEELMWGPAPAITPSANKLTPQPALATNQSVGDSDMAGFTKAGKKKKKGKRVDNSILGFTVQADPDRINVGEIEHIED